MALSKHPTTRSERLMGLLILIVLVWIGRWIFDRQFKFNPALAADTPAELAEASNQPPPAPVASFMSNFLPENLAPLSASEQYGPDTLSDKIDGRAELYLSAGVVKLQCQRFAHLNDPDSWMEVFVYDMGDARNAFAVYGIQRREDSQDIQLADFAYKTPNAVFFVHGKYYVELVASTASEIRIANMELFAKRFCENSEGGRQSVPEVALFPTGGLNAGSIILHLKDGLGFDKFDSLFVAGYKIGGAEVTAFLTVRETDADATELAKSYAGFLVANGGVEEQIAARITGRGCSTCLARTNWCSRAAGYWRAFMRRKTGISPRSSAPCYTKISATKSHEQFRKIHPTRFSPARREGRNRHRRDRVHRAKVSRNRRTGARNERRTAGGTSGFFDRRNVRKNGHRDRHESR